MSKSSPSSSPVRWLEAIIDVPSSAQDAVSARLFASGASAITELVDDLRFHIGDEGEEMFGDDPERVNLKALYEDQDSAALKAMVMNILVDMTPTFPGLNTSVIIETIEQEDWRDKWKEGFTVSEISPRLLLKPSWQEASPSPGQAVIEIDPGMAFGTGTHETTRACLELVDQILLEDPPPPLKRLPRPTRMLDVGTGTGILAIAAVKLGAVSGRGIDIDPLAVTAAKENASLNGVADALTIDGAPIQRVSELYELVVANILMGPLIELAEPIARRVADGGAILLSGLLVEQAAEVSEAYATLGFELTRQLDLGDWSALVLMKTP